MIPPLTQGKGQSGGGSNAQPKPYLNISETGNYIIQAVRGLALRTDRPLFGQHLKVIVVGESVASSSSLLESLDFNLREQEIRPSVLVFISKGRARNTLELRDKTEIPAFRLYGIAHNQYRSNRVLPPVSLTSLSGKLHSDNSFLLQSLVSEGGGVKFSGAGIIEGKTDKLIGFLNEQEVEGVTWISGKAKGGLVETFHEKTGRLIMYEIISMKSKIEPAVAGNRISFHVNIESTGRIAETSAEKEDAFKNAFLKRAEQATQKKVEQLVKQALDKMQKQSKVDVAGFGDELRIRYPHVWDNVKNDWDRTFSNVPITYNVKITVKEYGTKGVKKQ